MLKNIKWTVLALSLAVTPLLAEDLPEASVDITAEFVSTYVFRGSDIHASNYTSQKGTKDNGKTQAWTFQPDITFNTPVEGLTIGIWGSFAMDNRADTDSDQLLQQGPGGTGLMLHEAVSKLQGADLTSLSNANSNVNFQDPACRAAIGTTTSAASCVPGYYKEENGLYRGDEVDYTFAYERETKIGLLKGGVYYYTYPNVGAKSDAEQEVFIGYALPQVPELVFTVYTMVNSGGSSNQYFELAYENSFDINDDVAITYGASAGYSVKDKLQGIQNVDGSLGFEAFGFFASVNVSHRPDIRFFDTDSGNDQLPMYLVGSSTRADGLVTDQSKSIGQYNVLINTAIQAAIDASPIGSGVYTYTPRQKLPSEVYWVSVGYSTSI